MSDNGIGIKVELKVPTVREWATQEGFPNAVRSLTVEHTARIRKALRARARAEAALQTAEATLTAARCRLERIHEVVSGDADDPLA